MDNAAQTGGPLFCLGDGSSLSRNQGTERRPAAARGPTTEGNLVVGNPKTVAAASMTPVQAGSASRDRTPAPRRRGAPADLRRRADGPLPTRRRAAESYPARNRAK